jgi:hypothetical protein
MISFEANLDKVKEENYKIQNRGIWKVKLLWIFKYRGCWKWWFIAILNIYAESYSGSLISIQGIKWRKKILIKQKSNLDLTGGSNQIEVLLWCSLFHKGQETTIE